MLRACFQDIRLSSGLQVCVIPANPSWAGVFAVLSEKNCRKEGENHVSGIFFHARNASVH
jgi:hypothetical protein